MLPTCQNQACWIEHMSEHLLYAFPFTVFLHFFSPDLLDLLHGVEAGRHLALFPVASPPSFLPAPFFPFLCCSPPCGDSSVDGGR